jgi:ubiquinone/menaquinone biosynthesis C-methylase UbiE
MEPLINYFIDKKAENILDIGTGKGEFIPVLIHTFPGAFITGIDPNTESLEIASRHYPKIEFQKMGAEKLHFRDNTFDIISISMALHHLPKIGKSLKEIKRVVKPDGYLIINEPISDNLNPAQEVHKMYHHFRSRIDRILGTFHRKTFTSKAILQMLKTAELPVQFYFEQRRNTNLAVFDGELDLRIENMKQMLEKIKGRPEYKILQPQIEEFRIKALKKGFQPATNLVIVIRKLNLSSKKQELPS